MKGFALLIASVVCLNVFAAGPSISGGVSMAPWTMAAAGFNQVLDYLNKNAIVVFSLAYSKNSRSIVEAVVQCQDRKVVKLVFDVAFSAREVEVKLNSKSPRCETN